MLRLSLEFGYFGLEPLALESLGLEKRKGISLPDAPGGGEESYLSPMFKHREPYCGDTLLDHVYEVCGKSNACKCEQ